MTQMSDHHVNNELGFAANPARSLGVSPVARRVHDRGVALGVMLLSLLVGCVIPPSLSVENQDAGVNSPPAITAVRAESKALFEADTAVFAPNEGSLSLELIDTDINDTLYIRVFVDYTIDKPVNWRAALTVPSIAKVKRTGTVSVANVCTLDDVASNKTFNMTVHVFDRDLLDSGDPPFQAVPEGALSSSKFFFLQCKEST